MSKLLTTLATAIALAAALAHGQPSADTVDTQIQRDLHFHIAELAADAYEGREPGTPGEEKTIAWLQKHFAALGAEPGNRGSWVQEVPITAVTSAPSAVLAIRGPEFSADLAYGSEMMVATQQQVATTGIEDSELVFVGYGINAPERDWNDYAGVDVTGKTVVILINDPGYATQDPELFNGNAMTYYGRWDYKYAEAARQGAAGALIVHETDAAAYPWEVVRNSWSGANIGLTADNRHRDKLAVEGWLPLAQAEVLFQAAGLDYHASKKAAQQVGFKARPLTGFSASVQLQNSLADSLSRNVVALIPGTTHADEVIIYTAHWDHLGVRPDEEGDNIYNGASDNASGVAGLLAIARQLQDQATPPQRSILFLAVTAEESGLLGSKYYSENPIFPAAKTVANFNMDNIAAGNLGRTRDVAVVGYGNSELENYLARAAEAQGRVVVQEPYPEKGSYYRSDHFSLAQVGIPALYLTNATDSVEHGKAWGDERLKDYTANHYHKPSDEYDAGWDLSGAAQEVMLLLHMGRELAANRDFPNWHEGVEFKRARDASLQQ
ncbi:MAG: M28 family metallopeptidase [Haliea sp.]